MHLVILSQSMQILYLPHTSPHTKPEAHPSLLNTSSLPNHELMDNCSQTAENQKKVLK